MISRRNIRVKVMQTLYTVSSLENGAGEVPLSLNESRKILEQHFNQTCSLLVYLTWFLTEVARYAETYAQQRASKHLPTAEDLHVNTKIAGNETLWKMLSDPALKELFAAEKPEQVYSQSKDESNDLIRKIYYQLTATSQYIAYTSNPARNKVEEKNILEFIFNDLLLANEVFLAHVEESFSNWYDDGEMVVELLAACIHKPGSYDFKKMLSPDKKEFALTLLQTVQEKNEFLQSLIIPKLKNWDPERIALLDMIIMKMGVSEFLYFETIPPKVTINEYIDLAKEYSTAQSGQFVNGILDNIHKELVQSGKMKKIEYKKK
jgi:N utilization substance protein B